MGLRVIGGSLKGRKLLSIKGTITRPTSDRLREAIFNILSSRVQDSVVLDLFSGTGALGIEALSRGAGFAVFIDKDKASQAVIAKNIRACAVENKTRIIRWDITRNLNCIRSLRCGFRLVFMDPPYRKNMIAPTLTNLHQSGSLSPGGCIVIEHAVSESLPKNLEQLKIDSQRKYGKTLVSFLSYML